MKQLNIAIHPFSALAGMALLGLVWVTAGAMPLQGSSSTRDVSAIEVVSDPHPRDYVRMDGTTPYTVPTGKLFHLTGLGDLQASSKWVDFYIDGQVAMRTFVVPSGGTSCIVANTTPGVVAASGSILTVFGPTTPVAIGYLVDA